MKNKLFIAVIAFSLSATTASAFQITKSKNVPQPTTNSVSGPYPGFPIDGFVSLFAVAGAIFGAKKLRSRK